MIGTFKKQARTDADGRRVRCCGKVITMKKFNAILVTVVLLYLCLAAGEAVCFRQLNLQENTGYKVEINEIMKGLEEEKAFSGPDLRGKKFVQKAEFLKARDMDKADRLREFYRSRNGINSSFRPLIAENKLLGMVRFDYIMQRKDDRMLWITEGITAVCAGVMLIVLLFVRSRILKPFSTLSDMPYELAKGHLQAELQESRSRFFGKFVWGISMLRDTLHTARERELKLERDRKLLLLSLSHDIKIPLSTIKLYAKALREGVYASEGEQIHAAGQIECHALEIENFVKEIVAASNEDILDIEVEDSEFYLKHFMEKLCTYYRPKCGLMMTKLVIGSYQNKILKGDQEKAFEVMENLFENAFKYGDGRQISISFYEEDYCQIIRVFNTGEPVAAVEMPHLFDSFYRGSNVEEKTGNGLGLYISRQIMRKMEGDIFAQREKDGMSFCLVFRM